MEDAACWLALHSPLSYRTQDYQPRGSTAHSELDSSTSIQKIQICPWANLVGTFSQFKHPLSKNSGLCQVDLKVAKEKWNLQCPKSITWCVYLGYPWIHSDPPASAFQALSLKVCTTGLISTGFNATPQVLTSAHRTRSEGQLQLPFTVIKNLQSVLFVPKYR